MVFWRFNYFMNLILNNILNIWRLFYLLLCFCDFCRLIEREGLKLLTVGNGTESVGKTERMNDNESNLRVTNTNMV